ncbi:MAG: PEP/pyruvate-binding domain-containing protein [Myxococcota bacterium]
MTLRTSLALCVLLFAGCPDDGSGRDAADGATDATSDADAAPDGSDATDATGDVPSDATSDAPDVPVTSWPWPAESITVAPSAHWKADLGFPEETFRAAPVIYDPPQPTWVKFVVLTGDPTRIFFQESTTYPFHYDFAKAELPPFAGMSPEAFDAATLDNSMAKKAVLGAVLYAPEGSGGADQRREIGIQLVGRDPYPYVVTETVLALVRAHVTVNDGGAPPAFFYFPTFEQTDAAALDAARLEAAGFPVSSPERWALGDTCYATGWALGRLVQVPAGEIAAAYADGRLHREDILMTDGVPAEVPYVAGIVSTVPSTPSSHVAILATTFQVPFVYLATDVSRAAATALVGHTVALRTGQAFGTSALGACRVSLVDLGAAGDERLSAEDQASILALKTPAPLSFPPKASLGALAKEARLLTRADVRYFGGKASNFGILARTIPEASPHPAWGFSMDLWDRIIGPVKAQIAGMLADHHWPPDVAQLKADLADVRALVKGLSVSAGDLADVRQALETAGFDPLVNIRFRSSTNVEDQATFTGAGLYDSFSGCLADDTDDDQVGPSRCDPTEPDERGVMRAIKKVYASFWNDNAYLERLRHGVDEATVGMGLLVHPSFPDPTELANGVATVYGGLPTSTTMTLVTQLGAVSVTNPDSSAQPEVVVVSMYSFGTYLELRQQSSLVPLGGYVMTHEDDYKALAALLDSVTKAWAKDVAAPEDGFWLDFEYKKVRGAGSTPDHLEVKQVRALPRPSGTRDMAPFLLPEGPVELCTFQGEAGSVVGDWRLKARVRLAHRATWLDAAGLATSLYETARIERASGVDFDGDPATFTGASHAAPEHDQYGTAYPTYDRWTRGAGAGLETWALGTTLSWLVSQAESPLVVLGDGSVELSATYATPRPDPDAYPDGMTTSDSTRLTACPETVVVTPAYPKVERHAAVGGITVDIAFWWPPAPTGATAGYTAPLAKWDHTTISGLVEAGGGAPIELRGYWSQTYRPGHHNFSESFIFEPRVEAGIDPAVVAELDGKDIAALLVTVGYQEATIQIIGLDGKLRPLD